MRALVQRVRESSVTVNGEISGEIGAGLLIFLGVKQSDEIEDLDWLVSKCLNLRIFHDDQGKMNLSVMDTGGEVLVVSQFTLYGDTRKGNRPSFNAAAKPEKAETLYNGFVSKMSMTLGKRVETGVFGAHMDVRLLNDGPVTLMLEKEKATEKNKS